MIWFEHVQRDVGSCFVNFAVFSHEITNMSKNSSAVYPRNEGPRHNIHRRICNRGRCHGSHSRKFRQRLDNRKGPTILIWVPSHKGIPGPNLDVLRQHTFDSPSPPLGVLKTHPKKVLALASTLAKNSTRYVQQ